MRRIWDWFRGVFSAAEMVGTLYSWWHAQALIVQAILAAVAAVSAWNSALPLYMVVLVTSSVFAVGTVWSYVGLLFMRSVSPRHKLKVEGIIGNLTVMKNAQGVIQLTGATCEVALRNDADFPIRYILTKKDLVINKTVEVDPKYENAGFEMAPKTPDRLAFHRVVFSNPIDLGPEFATVTGRLAFTLVYGRPGREKYTFSRVINLYYSIRFADGKMDTEFEFREHDPESIERAKTIVGKIK